MNTRGEVEDYYWENIKNLAIVKGYWKNTYTGSKDIINLLSDNHIITIEENIFLNDLRSKSQDNKDISNLIIYYEQLKLILENI